MKWFIALSLSFILTLGVQAQLEPGYYEFESAMGLTYTGSWTEVNNGTNYQMIANTSSSIVEFEVDGDYMIIYRVMGTNLGQAEVCIDSVCSYLESKLATGNYQYTPAGYVLSGDDPHTVSIQRVNNSANNGVVLDSFMIWQTVSISGSSPESTPEPYYTYSTVSGTSGDIDTRFDMVVTAGDVAISSALLFLFFSIWVFILIYFLMMDC